MKRTQIADWCLIWLLFGFACDSDQPGLDATSVIPVSVNEVSQQTIREPVTTTGTIEAIKTVTLRSEIEGDYQLAVNPQTARHYKMGDWITQNLDLVNLSNLQRENEIKFEARKLSLETWQREYEKQKVLYEKGGVTLSEFKNTEANLINARYDFETAQILLAKFKIRTPFDGYVVDLPYYTPGTRIAANSTIAQIMDYRQLLLPVNLPDKELSRVNPGQTVIVYSYSLPADTLSGVVTEKAPVLDPATRTFKIMIVVQNKNNQFRPGMFVKVDIIIAARPRTIVIPKSIISTRRGNKTVFVVEKGAALERSIETGLQNRDEIEVLRGLKVGERLVVKGFETLRDRSRVKIIN
jgi:RND family efflux transporter MFP subunit